MCSPTYSVLVVIALVVFAGVPVFCGCPDECKDGSFLECYQCDSTTLGCENNVTLPDDYVILCPSSSHKCVFEYTYEMDGMPEKYKRDCRLHEGDPGWVNTTLKRTNYCETDRCNFSESSANRLNFRGLVFLLTLFIYTLPILAT